MSRELYAYIDVPEPVLRSDLAEAVEALGWSYRAFEDVSTFRPADPKYVRSSEIVVWDDGLDLATEIDAAIARGDQSVFDRLYGDELIGIVSVDHEAPFTPDPEMLTELNHRAVDPVIIDRIGQAQQLYSVRTSGGRNDFSLEVQTALATLLAIARYGVLEDPQEGTFENLSQAVVEDGDEEASDKRNKPWWKFW